MTEKYRSADVIILRGAAYGEGNRIFTCFGREEGKFSAVARGVLKPKSKLKGHLQLGNRCTLTLSAGRGMDTVTSAMATETYCANREKAELYFYTSYFLELCNDFMPEHLADPAVFDLLDGVLKSLSEGNPKLLARFFELRMLILTGYAPDLTVCAACGEKLQKGALNPRFSGIICPKCGGGYEISPKTLFALKYLCTTELPLLYRLKTDEETDRLLAQTTKQLLETGLERKIRSLEILKQV